jgi:YD repeat-containing protein
VLNSAGQVRFTVDALGGVVETVYDAAGNVARTIAYDTAINSTSVSDTLRPQDVRALLPASTLNPRETIYAYDANGRLVYTAQSIATNGSVKTFSIGERQYNALGQVSKTITYATSLALQDLPSVAQVADFRNRIATQDGTDRTTQTTYDRVGRVSQTTDAAGGKQSFTYDAFGNKLTFTNEKNSVWTYTYDKLGRMVTETSPTVALTVLKTDNNGSLVVDDVASKTAAVITTLRYDAFGNLLSRTEATGTSNERTTSYTYDALGRQTKVTYPSIRVYNAATSTVSTVNEDPLPLTTQTFYDAFGNAVANIDVAGSTSYKAYDVQGRVRYEVDAMGFVTGYDRDVFGQALTVTRYWVGTSLANGTPTSAGQAPTAAQIATIVNAADHSKDRTITNQYDRRGLLTEARESATYTFDGDTKQGNATAGKTTRNTYDAFGQLIKVARLRNATIDQWTYVYNYYDRAGHQVASIDELGYLTRRSFSAFGEQISVVEYAKPVSGFDETKNFADPTYGNPPTSNDDRRTDTIYDAMGRKTSESRLNVEYTENPQPTSVTSVRGAITTYYGYDAVGNLTSTTDTYGKSTYSYYDAMGRVTAVAAPMRDAPGTSTSASLTPLTVFRRDALGNVVVKIDYADGSNAASDYTGVSQAGSWGYTAVATNGVDHATYTVYDTLGHATQTMDANGVYRFNSYNQRGQLARTWQSVNSNDSGTSTLFQINQYDKLGRLIKTEDPAPTTIYQAGLLATLGTSVVNLSWAGLIDRAGGNVEVSVDYMQGQTIPGTGVYQLAPANSTYTYTAAESAAGVAVTAQYIQQLKTVQVRQLVAGSWVVRWSGTAAQAVGNGVTLVSQSTAGTIRTNYDYNAFGEMTSKGVNEGQQEYFEYDNAGRLWHTNSGDGIDKVFLYDLQDHQTADIRSAGSAYASNRDFSHNAFNLADIATVAGWSDTRRVDMRYDQAGRLVERLDPTRDQLRTGVATRSLSLSASILEVGTATGAKDKISVSWTTLQGLGAGGVKVQVDYTSKQSVSRTATQILTNEEALSGATVSWYTPVTYPAGADGISKINHIVVYKQDADGKWQPVMERYSSGFGVSYGIGIEAGTPRDGLSRISGFKYRVQGNSGWISVPADNLINFGDAVRVDGSRIPLSTNTTYEYQVLTTGPDGVEVAGPTLSFNTGTPTNSTTNAVSPRPMIRQLLDRWGNVLEVNDPRSLNWITRSTYNANNQRISELKPGGSGGFDGSSPMTLTYYDRLGRQVAVQDANGHINAQQYDSAGNVIREIHADRGVVTYTYNAFSDRTSMVDAVGNDSSSDAATKQLHTTVYEYDKLDRLKVTQHTGVDVYALNADMSAVAGSKQTLRETIDYDWAGRKIKQTDAAGHETRYKLDLAGHVIETVQLGATTRTTYDAYGHKTSEIDANTNASLWTYDYFGRALASTDIGGALYLYNYDNARQLTAQLSVRPNATGQNLTNTYDAAGQLVKIVDASDSANKKITTYDWDLAGHHVREKTTQGSTNPTVAQDNHLAYDTLGRLALVTDERARIAITYDSVGNRRSIKTHVNTGLVNSGTTRQDSDTSRDTERWFQYDEMNRQTVVDGLNPAGSIGTVVDPADGTKLISQGHTIAYDKNGNRISDVFWGNRIKTTAGYTIVNYDDFGNPTYQYDVPPTYSTDSGFVTETYKYDALDRLTRVDRLLQGPNDVNEAYVTLDRRLYSADGRVVQGGPNGTLPTAYAAALNAGTPSGQAIGLETQRNLYDATTGRLVHKKLLKSDNTAKADLYYDAAASYDAAGNVLNYRMLDAASGINYNYTTTLKKFDGYKEGTISGAASSGSSPGSTTETYDANGFLVGITDSTMGSNNRTFINDANGRALMVTQNTNVQRQMVVNGEVLATYGVGIDRVTPKNGDGSPRFAPVADFNFGFQSITGNYPAASVGMYTVRTGDTLRSIAASAFGDEALWFQIAQANGVTGDRDLRVGQTISIPSKVGTIHNNSGTFKPFDVGSVIGDTTPNLPALKKDDCGALGQLVMVVIAAAVATYTGGGALGAVLGSITSQVVGKELGIIDKFDWKQVALAAVTGAVGSGLQLNPLTGSPIANTIIRGVINNAVNQGMSIALGLQDDFNWKAVAAAGLGSFVGQQIGDGLDKAGAFKDLGNFGADFARKSVTGISSGVTTSLAKSGRVSLGSVAADAFGNALGESLTAQSSGAYEQAMHEKEPWPAEGESEYVQQYGAANNRTALNAANQLADPTYYGPLQASQQAGYEAPDDFGASRVLARKRFARFKAGDPIGYGPSGTETFDEVIDRIRDAHRSPANRPSGTNLGSVPTLHIGGNGVSWWDRPTVADAATVDRSLNNIGLSADAYRDSKIQAGVTGDPYAFEPEVPEGRPGGPGIGQLAADFAGGAVLGVVGIPGQAAANLIDLGTAALSVGYNELVRPFTGGKFWDPELISETAKAYARGTSQTKLVLGSIPILNVGVLSYDVTTALNEGRPRDAARALGGAAGGLLVGAGVQKYGQYGVHTSFSGAGSTGGNVRFSISSPKLSGELPSTFRGKLSDLDGLASRMKTLKPGTKEWAEAVQEMREAAAAGEKIQVKVGSSSEAKALLKEAHGNMDRHKAHTQSRREPGVPKYPKGYEQHVAPEKAPADLSHIKFYIDETDGHIFYDVPN